MLNDLSFPFIQHWSEDLRNHWHNHSKILFDHPSLSYEQKMLWKWLATTSNNATEFKIQCSHSYEQISLAMNYPCLVTHRLLFGLKLMGFIRSRLPVVFDFLSNDMIIEIRKLELCMPSKVFSTGQEAVAEINKGVRIGAEELQYSLLRY